jgi:acetate kinase
MTISRVLVLNPGSSSLKASLIELPDTTLAQADKRWGSDASRTADRSTDIRDALEALGDVKPDAVGYRVVHGGSRFTAPTLIDDAAIEGIEAVRDLAPLHNTVALETIEAGRALLPDLPHVACFDTAFHATLEPEAYRYPVPEPWFRDWGVRRYGFHGLSVQWSTQRAAELLGRPARNLGLVVAHLGSGCSVTAVENGRSVATSMGMTPLDGLMMGTRSGSIDPGVPIHLAKTGHIDWPGIGEALDHESGLLGVSGSSSDMRSLRSLAKGGDRRAVLAIDMFTRSAAAGIAAAATALPRLDALVFTGGIGEHADDVRRGIIDRLAAIGIAPLPHVAATDAVDERLSDEDSSMAILRIEAREDLMIAEQSAVAASLP